MVRTYQRKSTYSKYNKEHVLKAVKAIRVDSKSLSKVADEYGIKVSSLYYHLNRYKDYDFTKDKDIKALKNYNQVFEDDLEDKFVEEFVDATDYCLGLGPLNIRKFAYEFAMHHEIDLRQTWMENEAAGEDWLNAFLKRHPTIANISSYNTHSIQMYFKNYEDLLEKHGFEDSQIFKADEIAFTSAKQYNRVFARRGKKEESGLQFLGQDELTTMISTISASGTALTPMFIIPRTCFVSDMIEKALEGSIKVSSKSGWMTKSDFLEYLAHFVKVTQCSKTDPCLLMLDNHASCLSLEAIAYAKKNGVFLLLLPLHTYNKLQPLKEKLFADLRTKVNSACRKWVASNTKKPMKIKDILGVVEEVFPKVFTSNDIKMGFESSNIYPVNSSSFSDENTSGSKDAIMSSDNDDNSHDADSVTEDTGPVEKNTDPVGTDVDSDEKDTDSDEKGPGSIEKHTDHIKEEADPDEKNTDFDEKDAGSIEKHTDDIKEEADCDEKDTDSDEKGAGSIGKKTDHIKEKADSYGKNTDSDEKDAVYIEKHTDHMKGEADFDEKNTDSDGKDAGSIEKHTDHIKEEADSVEKATDQVEEDADSVEEDADSVEKDTDPVETDTVEKDTDPVEKEELETADEVVVIYSPKDANSSKKIPLAQIEQILGITLEKKDRDMTSTEQKENIVDHSAMNEGEQKTDSEQLNEDVDMIIKKVSNTPKKNKLDKSNKSETDKRKRRKPNSKLSDYVCY